MIQFLLKLIDTLKYISDYTATSTFMVPIVAIPSRLICSSDLVQVHKCSSYFVGPLPKVFPHEIERTNSSSINISICKVQLRELMHEPTFGPISGDRLSKSMWSWGIFI